MKVIRTIAALVLVACAIFAAYFSYSRTMLPPAGLVPASAGPPRGFGMPGMGHKRPSAEHKKPAGKGAGAEKSATEKGGEAKSP